MLKLNHVSLTFNQGTQDEKKAIDDVTLHVKKGDFISIIGANGAGKSTLFNVIAGTFITDSGNIYLDDKDITTLEADERSKLGIFLGMQYPSEVPGVNNADFLKAAINAHQEKPVSLFKFYQMLDQAYKRTSIPFEMSTRNLNEGFSGGEKKKNEILQMLLLNPKFTMLDEIDSGLDVDAIQVVANVIKEEQEKGKGFLIISHYARLYNLINIDRVAILMNGKIVLEGNKELIKKIDESGYEWLRTEHGIEIEKEEQKMNQISIGTCATKEALKK